MDIGFFLTGFGSNRGRERHPVAAADGASLARRLKNTRCACCKSQVCTFARAALARRCVGPWSLRVRLSGARCVCRTRRHH